MASVPTIQIKVPPTKGNEAGVLTINEADFDPTQHVRVGEEAPVAVERGSEHESKASRKAKKDQG
jgi:hypothetical protein